jgi:hypothetical protein
MYTPEDLSLTSSNLILPIISIRTAQNLLQIAGRVMILFDTGASSGNFVSNAFVEKYNLQVHLPLP